MNSSVRLVAFDMEGCLTRDPTVWEIMHRLNGTWRSHGEPYWNRYLDGGLPYDEFAVMDVAAWRGAPATLLRRAAEEVQLMPGAERLLRGLHAQGLHTVLISNGLMCVARRFSSEYGMDAVFANTAVEKDGFLTGELRLDVPYNSKGDILNMVMKQTGISPARTAAVGDGPADVNMFDLAGTSIAVCPKDDVVRKAATEIIEDESLVNCAELIPGAARSRDASGLAFSGDGKE